MSRQLEDLKNHIFRADRYLKNDLALFGAVGLNDLMATGRKVFPRFSGVRSG